jgi:hypothetical protein
MTNLCDELLAGCPPDDHARARSAGLGCGAACAGLQAPASAIDEVLLDLLIADCDRRSAPSSTRSCTTRGSRRSRPTGEPRARHRPRRLRRVDPRRAPPLPQAGPARRLRRGPRAPALRPLPDRLRPSDRDLRRDPYGLLCADFDFGPGAEDVSLLRQCAAVAAMAHAPLHRQRQPGPVPPRPTSPPSRASRTSPPPSPARACASGRPCAPPRTPATSASACLASSSASPRRSRRPEHAAPLPRDHQASPRLLWGRPSYVFAARRRLLRAPPLVRARPRLARRLRRQPAALGLPVTYAASGGASRSSA